MTDKSMIERVARAICREHGDLPDYPSDAGPPKWHLYVPEARAAIEAMRDPTQGMIDAGDACEGHAGYEMFGPKWAADVWPAMIDAVLKEDKK